MNFQVFPKDILFFSLIFGWGTFISRSERIEICFFANIPMLRVEEDSAMKKWGHIKAVGVLIFGDTTL